MMAHLFYTHADKTMDSVWYHGNARLQATSNDSDQILFEYSGLSTRNVIGNTGDRLKNDYRYSV